MIDSSLVVLPHKDVERLIYAIDGSLKVHRRFQFFLWTQGGLQGLLPHETLICAWGEIESANYECEVFSRAVLDDKFTRRLADPVDGLLPRLIDEWLKNERRPCIYAADATEWERVCYCSPALTAEFRRLGFQRVIAHGSCFKDGTSSFFVFVNGPVTFTARDTYLVEMLMPHLHSTLHRVAEGDGDKQFVTAVSTGQVLSDREAQVLGWVRDGKTNQEIAQILDISPLTVKNHIQKILRKLKVTNRTQAVARAIGARILDDREFAG
jgi:transcriptional regulator EpsA